MIQIQLNLPESAFSVLHGTPDEFGQELLIAAVVKWYEMGMISQFYAGKITVSGKDGADAKPYQEKEILRAIKQVEDAQNDR